MAAEVTAVVSYCWQHHTLHWEKHDTVRAAISYLEHHEDYGTGSSEGIEAWYDDGTHRTWLGWEERFGDRAKVKKVRRWVTPG